MRVGKSRGRVRVVASPCVREEGLLAAFMDLKCRDSPGRLASGGRGRGCDPFVLEAVAAWFARAAGLLAARRFVRQLAVRAGT